MYDGILLRVKGNQSHLLNNKNISFSASFNPVTSEIFDYPIKSKPYKSLRIKIGKFNTEIRGSIHKYAQNGFNLNNLTFHELYQAISQLSKELIIPKTQFTLHSVEFGVNITPPFTPTLVNIQKNFIGFSNRSFSVMESISPKKIGVKCDFENYEIKIYSKTIQENLDYPLLRIEVKFKRMQQLFKKNETKKQFTLNNLADYGFFQRIKKNYMNIIEMIMIREEFNKTMNTQEKLFCSEAINPNYWIDLDRRVRNKQKVKYTNLVNTYSTTEYKKKLINLIKEEVLNSEDSFQAIRDNLLTSIKEQNVIIEPNFNFKNSNLLITKNYRNGTASWKN